jgi:hypothetical protein
VVRPLSLQIWKKDIAPPAHSVNSQFSADEIIVIATSIPAHRPAYRRDLLLSTEAEIIVNASKVLSTEMATLVIEDTDSNTHMARAELVVLVKPERWLPLVVLFIAFGTFLASVSSDMVVDIALLFQVHNLLPAVATTIAYTIKGIGSALVALGAYLGFRKIPPN